MGINIKPASGSASAGVTPVVPTVPAAVTVKQAAITVGTSAVKITTDGAAPSATRRSLRFMLDPSSTANCYIGSASVTSAGGSRGLPLQPGVTHEYLNDPNDYYLVSDIAGQTVYVVEAE